MYRQLFTLSILLFLIGGFHKGVVSAETTTTITVCTSGCTTDTWGTAINLANSFDTVSILNDLQVTDGAVISNKTVTILGNGYEISKASGSTGAFLGVIEADVTIHNLAFRGGNKAVTGTNGGALWATDDSTLTLNNVDFFSNLAESGGALYIRDSVANVDNSLFQGNFSYGEGGGAIYSVGSTLSIDNTVFQSNRATQSVCCGGRGGAIYSRASTLTVENSDFRFNTATNNGGGGTLEGNGGAINWSIYYSGYDTTASLSLYDNTFYFNEAEGGGGGVYFDHTSYTTLSTTLNIRRNLFQFNFAETGGGLKGFNRSSPIIANNTFVDNRASERGGGMEWWSVGGGRLESNTIYRNQAPEAANVHFSESTLTNNPATYKVRNNIIAWPQGGGDNCSDEDLDVTNLNSTADYNNLDDDGSCDGFTIEDDPLLVGPADNGGPTYTMRPLVGSPVFNQANWDGTVGSEDQRGVQRGNGGVSDLGAYERVVQNDCQVINQMIPGGSSTGLTKVSTFPSSLSGEIIDVDVTIELDDMYYLSDIFASVKSPGNLPLTIIDRPKYSPPDTEYGCFTGSLNGVFDNDGFYPTLDSTCTESGAGISGNFKPKNNLTSWNGTQTEGNWVLNVTDATSPFQAKLARWCVSVEYFPDSAETTPTAVTVQNSQVSESPLRPPVLSLLWLSLALSTLYLQRRS